VNRVVFDCMVFIQAIARRNGPAATCLSQAIECKFELIVSNAVLAEIREVVYRPKLRRTFIRASDEDIEDFFSSLAKIATLIEPVPDVFALKRDPDDSKYINLAIAADAKIIVSRDNDLLDLLSSADDEAKTFRTAFPNIRILDPVEFLKSLTPNTETDPSSSNPPKQTPSDEAS